MHMCPNCGVSFRKFEPVLFGNIMIDDVGDVYFEGRHIPVSSNVGIVVKALIRSQGRTFTMDAIGNLVSEDITNNGIRQLMKRVRDAFRAVDPHFDQVESVHKVGYRWRYIGAMQAAA
jgi:DNA-binding response OmpR family regulator